MKENKKLLVIAILLLLITVSFTTYVIYKSSTTGESTINTAAWVVKVGITYGWYWGSTTVVKNNKIAPGDKGTIEIKPEAIPLT